MQYSNGYGIQLLPQACIVDLTPPTFAGIVSAVANLNGSISLSWNPATSPTPPIRYAIYAQRLTASGLFVPDNILCEVQETTFDVYEDADSFELIKGEQYHFGVRALNGENVSETNTVSVFAISNGIINDQIADILTEIERLASKSCRVIKGVVRKDKSLQGKVSC